MVRTFYGVPRGGSVKSENNRATMEPACTNGAEYTSYKGNPTIIFSKSGQPGPDIPAREAQYWSRQRILKNAISYNDMCRTTIALFTSEPAPNFNPGQPY